MTTLPKATRFRTQLPKAPAEAPPLPAAVSGAVSTRVRPERPLAGRLLAESGAPLSQATQAPPPRPNRPQRPPLNTLQLGRPVPPQTPSEVLEPPAPDMMDFAPEAEAEAAPRPLAPESPLKAAKAPKDKVAGPHDVANPPPPADLSAIDAEIEAIRAENLTGRQLRLARRMAEKYQIPATSDFDAVRLLRKRGLDPFGRATMLDIVAKESGQETNLAQVETHLPQRASPRQLPSTEIRMESSHASDIARIQRDIARRRRRRMALLWIRLSMFVGLPTLMAAIYYTFIATPMYATRSEFVIQQAEAAGAGGLGGLFSGTQFATSQDSIAVQGYLQSREAMLRLDESLGFRAHFSDPKIDLIQRLEDANSVEKAYSIYRKYVKIAYDQSEGIIKLEVSAADPEVSTLWSRQLISYAEEQVNHLSERLRGDQMRGARDSFDDAEAKLLAAQEKVVLLQERNKVLSSEVEITLLSGQISALETQLTQERLALAQMLANPNPNRARVDPVQRRVQTLESEIATLRGRMTESNDSTRSIARVQSELLVAQADVQTRQLLLTQAAQQLETARIEANRQQRYLSVSVAPVGPDVASYPRAFENTLVALLIFTGIYLMIALTASILREQVAN